MGEESTLVFTRNPRPLHPLHPLHPLRPVPRNRASAEIIPILRNSPKTSPVNRVKFDLPAEVTAEVTDLPAKVPAEVTDLPAEVTNLPAEVTNEEVTSDELTELIYAGILTTKIDYEEYLADQGYKLPDHPPQTYPRLRTGALLRAGSPRSLTNADLKTFLRGYGRPLAKTRKPLIRQAAKILIPK